MLVGPALFDPQPPLEPERQAHVEEFEHVDIRARRLFEPREKIVETVAATVSRWKVATIDCTAHDDCPPQGVFRTTSSSVAQSA